ncbi:MAG: DAK2 domain-containing protein [Clostridia bacterium]|nr:DAK2 domain-containing protein [Clostridia bacterium]
MQQHIDGKTLNYLFTMGYRNLKKNIQIINDLNVFPVPDGDTGTNMVHTFGGGLASVKQSNNINEYTESLAQSVLLNARGNSGVIFSQFVNGFARGLKDKTNICFGDLALAFKYAKDDAYNSIMVPTEGTILTIIRESAEFLDKNAEQFSDFKSGFEALLELMKSTLAKTPEMLPVLKEAGVVDSGAAGLVCFFEGIYAYFCGISIDSVETIDLIPTQVSNGTVDFGPDSVMEYGYCTEFILQLMNKKVDIAAFSRDKFLRQLEEMGDSIVCALSGSILKLHIHTFTPEKVLAYARNFGEFINLKIENMSVQHNETQIEAKREKVKYAVIPVVSGDGIIEYFESIGATAVINGGQTNNPSVEDFLNVIKRFDAEHIILLPNNSNIILTANQVAQIYNEVPVHIIPTKTIVEGYSALSMMNLWCEDVETLITEMSSGLDNVVTASVTTATRDAKIGNVEIFKNQYLGIKNKDIILSGENRLKVTRDLINQIMCDEDKSIIIVFYGKNADESEVNALQNYLKNEYPLADIGFIEGKQDIYDYIISLE